MNKEGAPLHLKIFCWIILTVLSAVLAEVPATSMPDLLINPWGLCVTTPLYGLHILFFATLVYRYGRPTFFSLFFAGALFGLYEAYLTKMLWAPTWNPKPISLGGVAVIETIILTLWWHNWMAFILPLAAGEWLLTRSRLAWNGLPSRVTEWLTRPGRPSKLFIASGALCGLFLGAKLRSPQYGVAVIAANTGIVLILVAIWRWATSGRNYTLKELLPGKLGLLVLILLLGFVYFVFGKKLRSEALPPLRAQMTIWGLYLFYGWLFLTYLRRSRRASTEVVGVDEIAPASSGTIPDVVPPVSHFSPPPWPYLMFWIFAFMAAAALTRLAFPNNFIFMLLGWLAGGLLGISLLVVGLWGALQTSDRHGQ